MQRWLTNCLHRSKGDENRKADILKNRRNDPVMEIRKKHLDRREWYTDSERNYSCLYHHDDYFQGGIGLITFTGLAKPDIVDTVEGPFCIADQG